MGLNAVWQYDTSIIISQTHFICYDIRFFFFFEKKCRGALEDEIEYCDVKKKKKKNTVVKSKKM